MLENGEESTLLRKSIVTTNGKPKDDDDGEYSIR